MPSSARTKGRLEAVKSAINNTLKSLLILIIRILEKIFWAVIRLVCPTDAAKNEGEPLHIVSPSTIPLTLGEEMAVLLLPV
jgi:hypothetical protein